MRNYLESRLKKLEKAVSRLQKRICCRLCNVPIEYTYDWQSSPNGQGFRITVNGNVIVEHIEENGSGSITVRGTDTVLVEVIPYTFPGFGIWSLSVSNNGTEVYENSDTGAEGDTYEFTVVCGDNYVINASI